MANPCENNGQLNLEEDIALFEEWIEPSVGYEISHASDQAAVTRKQIRDAFLLDLGGRF